MKIVILLPTLPGYRKDFFETLNTRLSEKGIKLFVIHGTGFFKKSIQSDIDPKYSTIPLKTYEFKLFGFRIVWWKSIFKHIRKIQPGILIILFSPGNLSLWFTQLYCYLKRIDIGIWSSGFVRQEITGVKSRIRDIFLNFFLYRAKFHICYGTKYKNELLDMGIEKTKIFVAQNTLNIEKIITHGTVKKKNITSDSTFFLFVGALIPDKNLDLAIKAIAKLVREGNKIIFNIIGQGQIMNELKALVIEEQMEDYIFILGPKYDKELISYFIDADIFILPGTGGLAINEAMAYGLPIISTPGDGTVIDLVNDGINGFLLNDIVSVENIYATCKKALKNEKPQLVEMGAIGKQIVTEKASLKNMVSNFESAILNGIG